MSTNAQKSSLKESHFDSVLHIFLIRIHFIRMTWLKSAKFLGMNQKSKYFFSNAMLSNYKELHQKKSLVCIGFLMLCQPLVLT